MAGIVFGDPIKKQPKGSKVFTGLERRPSTLKPLKSSPFQKGSISLLPKKTRLAPTRLKSLNFQSPFDIKKKKGKRRKK